MTPRDRQLSATIDLLRVEFDDAAAAHDFQLMDVLDGLLDGLETIVFWAKPAA